MTIDEAIKVEKDNADYFVEECFPVSAEASRLGLEALKVIKAIRPYSNSNKSYYLPGETKT